MVYIFYYIGLLFITFLIVYFVSYFIPMKRKRLGLQNSFKYIVKKYDLSMNEKRVKLLCKMIAGVNAFILSLAFMLVLFFEINLYILFIMSFIIFIILILCLYNIVGIILKKKGW